MNTGKCDPIGRMLALGYEIARGSTITSGYIVRRFGVSWATANRDLGRIESVLPVRVTVEPSGCGGYFTERKTVRLMESA